MFATLRQNFIGGLYQINNSLVYLWMKNIATSDGKNRTQKNTVGGSEFQVILSVIPLYICKNSWKNCKNICKNAKTNGDKGKITFSGMFIKDEQL